MRWVWFVQVFFVRRTVPSDPMLVERRAPVGLLMLSPETLPR